MAYSPKSFEEWWKGSGQVRGEAIFRNCWDAAIEAAAKAGEDCIAFDMYDPGSTWAEEVRKLKTGGN